MKKFLIPLLAALALPVVVNAGIPKNQSSDKWVRVNEKYLINTKDVKIKRGKLTFYVEREATEKESLDTDYRYSWDGRVKINCDKLTFQITTPPYSNFYAPPYRDIKKGTFPYDLANYFCYLTGSEGYTRESSEPNWVTKIINNVEANKIEKKKKLGNINCDSPVWKKKPICN